MGLGAFLAYLDSFGSDSCALERAELGVLKLAESLPSVDRPDLATLTLDAAGRYFVSF